MRTIIKTDKTTIIAILVADNTYDYNVHNFSNNNGVDPDDPEDGPTFYLNVYGKYKDKIYYPESSIREHMMCHTISRLTYEEQYEILGLADELTLDQIESIVDIVFNEYYKGYKDYFNNLSAYHSASESWNSLLIANKVYTVNPYGENEPERMVAFKSPGTYTDNDRYKLNKYKQELNNWTDAKQRTGKWLILKLK